VSGEEHSELQERPEPSSSPGETQSFTVEGLFRVARAFLVPFLLSWTVAYVGGEWGVEWLYYAGLGGVGISIIGLMVWLLHQ
jgi:hypothetical protein